MQTSVLLLKEDITMTSASTESPSRKIVVVGQGYVGLPLAMRSVAVGYDVVGYDVSEERVMRLQEGESFIEDISNSEIKTAQNSGRYAATTRIEDCHKFDVAVITVPTPLREGVPDLSFIEDAAHKLGQNLTEGATLAQPRNWWFLFLSATQVSKPVGNSMSATALNGLTLAIRLGISAIHQRLFLALTPLHLAQ
jgi:threonine dehydrogenase-like Zn-dependent dehydrogenase